MFEYFILGMVQGIAEWLPVSSEAMIILVKNNFFPSSDTFSDMISFAIFLHLGTFFAALVYFRKKVLGLMKDLLNYSHCSQEKKEYLNFIITVTIVSGVFGFLILKTIAHYESVFNNEFIINLVVAVFLGITAILLYISEQRKNKEQQTVLSLKRAFLTGFFQSLAALPGISRSGTTIGVMGLLNIQKEKALELSFILSIPLVFFANIILNYNLLISFNLFYGLALISSFIFGIITIHGLLLFVKRVRFSYFVGLFALLVILLNLIV